MTSFDPFGLFQLPFSGNVSQQLTTPWFSPAVTINYAGDAAVEQRVVSDVASYGRQIGWLNEIVLALVARQAPPAATVARLQDAVDEIARIKQGYQRSRLQSAQEALDRLAQEDPPAYAALLRQRIS